MDGPEGGSEEKPYGDEVYTNRSGSSDNDAPAIESLKPAGGLEAAEKC